jgi:phospholipid transport system substrate-binding protein
VSMRRFLPIAAFALTAAGLALAPAMAARDPAAMISDLDREARPILAQGVPPAERRATFLRLFQADFYVRAIAQFVLGPHWRAASEPERQEFMELFANYTAGAYAKRLADFSDAKLRIVGTRMEPYGAQVTTETVPAKGGPPVKIDWRLNRYDETYKISDVIVGNVSMAATQRAEFADLIERSGGQVQSLFAMLRDKTANAAAAR